MILIHNHQGLIAPLGVRKRDRKRRGQIERAKRVNGVPVALMDCFLLPIFLQMNLSRFLLRARFESLLRQQREHGFTHMWAAANENVGIFRPRAGTPCLFDGPALPHVLNVTRCTFPGNRFFIWPADNWNVGKVGPKVLHGHQD